MRSQTPTRRYTHNQRSGLLLASVTAVISGAAVFINGYGVRAWGEISDPTTYTTLKNAVAAVALISAASIISRRRGTRAGVAAIVRPETPREWLGLAAVAVVGGAVAFALFFEGLARASSGQAAFLHKTMVVWVAILAVGILRERIGPAHVGAVVLLLWGQAILGGGLGGLAFGAGETMILAATLLWAGEVVVAKRLLQRLTPATVGIARMAGRASLLIAYGIWRGSFGAITGLSLRHLGWVALTGIVLSLYVASWYTALARARAIDVTAILVGGSLITAVLRTGIGGAPLPSPAGLALVGTGVVVIAVVTTLRHRLPQGSPG